MTTQQHTAEEQMMVDMSEEILKSKEGGIQTVLAKAVIKHCKGLLAKRQQSHDCAHESTNWPR